ncbi:MAG: LVIVD repeat-containing protein [Promethearchaeota archaeon]
MKNIKNKILTILGIILLIFTSGLSTFTNIDSKSYNELDTLRMNSNETYTENFTSTAKIDVPNTDAIQWGYGKITNSKFPPQRVGRLEDRGLYYAYGLYVAGNYAYVGFGPWQSLDPDPGYDFGFLIIDISNKSNPVEVGRYQAESYQVWDPYLPGYQYLHDAIQDICVIGDLAYCAGIYTFQIVNISDPSNPTLVAKADGWTPGVGIDVVYPYAYVTTWRPYQEHGIPYIEDDTLTIIDISSPDNPIKVGSVEIPLNWDALLTGSRNIDVSYPYAYIAGRNQALTVVDVSNPSNPIVIASCGTENYDRAWEVYISGNYAYIADFGKGFLIMDISNPSNPVLTSQFIPWRMGLGGGSVRHVCILENYAYIDSHYLDSGHEQVIDISNKNNPIIVAQTRFGIFGPLTAIDNYLYQSSLAGNLASFYILDISDRDLYVPVCTAQSITINSKGYVENAKILTVEDIPSGTDIEYYLTADGGEHWEEVTPGLEHNFMNPGFDLQWCANLSTSHDYIAPSISQITIEYDLDIPPTMDPIIEPQGQHFLTAPIISHLGFNDDVALDDGWYQLDSHNGVWIPLFTDNGGTEWDFEGWTLPDFGSLSEDSHMIYFKVSDEMGNIVGENGEWRWQFNKITNPIVTINLPMEDRLFGFQPPTYNISIDEENLDSVWYTLDDGITNISITELTGTIDDFEWEKKLSGSITIFFYVNDTFENIGSESVIILKDVDNPEITINDPSPNEQFKDTAPLYDFSIIEPNLNLMWYTIDGGVTNYTITELTGSINQTAWEAVPYGNITIGFYVEDLVGNIGYSEVTVEKVEEKQVDQGISGYNLVVFMSLIGVITTVLLKKKIKN